MNYRYCLTGMLLLSMKVWSQEIKPLSVGDRVPSININNILNSPALSANLSAYKDKLVILNFMASSCASCLKVLPRFDSLQKSYGDKIKVFLVTYEKKEKVKKFLQSRPSLQLSVIGEDTILKQYFPHTYISHEVWIKDGVVKAITHPEYVTANNIETVLVGETISWPVKRDLADFNYEELLKVTTERISSSYYYTTLTRHLDGVPRKVIQHSDTVRKVARALFVNLSLIEMYMKVYGKSRPKGHVMLRVQNSSRYIYNTSTGYDAWRKENTYCYEAVLPLHMPEIERKKKMVADLEFYFGTKGRIDTIPVTAYELQRVDTSLHLLSKEASRKRAAINGSMSLSVKELMYMLNDLWYGIPAYNATGYEKDYLNIPHSITDLTSMEKALSAFGLCLAVVERVTPILVITDFKN